MRNESYKKQNSHGSILNWIVRFALVIGMIDAVIPNKIM